MNPLQNLSHEQIKALSPECFKILLSYSQNDKSDDIAKMKYYFKQLKYDNNVAKYVESEAAELRRLLLKYHKENFYLTYEIFSVIEYGAVIIYNINYELHTIDDINEILPTGVDLKKLCFSGQDYKSYDDKKREKNRKYIECPIGYGTNKFAQNIIYRIPELLYFHNNLNIVHPKLLEAAKYFFDS